MSVKINRRNQENAVIYELEGRLDTSGSATFKIELDMAVIKPTGHIIIDMSKVSFISSAGIGVTVKAHSMLKQKGFEVRVASANDEVKKIYDLLGFSNVVKLYPTLADALHA